VTAMALAEAQFSYFVRCHGRVMVSSRFRMRFATGRVGGEFGVSFPGATFLDPSV
jgi:hypothetical protein